MKKLQKIKLIVRQIIWVWTGGHSREQRVQLVESLVHNAIDCGRDACGLECFHAADFQICRSSRSIRPETLLPQGSSALQVILRSTRALQRSNATSRPTWNVKFNESRQQQNKGRETCWNTINQSINHCVPVALQYLRNWFWNICANVVSKRPPSPVLNKVSAWPWRRRATRWNTSPWPSCCPSCPRWPWGWSWLAGATGRSASAPESCCVRCMGFLGGKPDHHLFLRHLCF